MPAASHRVHATTLAWEEIRALPRQTFALAVVAVLLAILAPFASVALEGPSAFRDHLLFTWVVGQLVVAILLAARIAAVRRTRFAESIYTTPLRPGTWLGAQVLVGAFLCLLVLLPQVPFLLVHLVLVGVPTQLAAIALATMGMAAFAIALGVFCGVIVGDAGPGAAAGLAAGFSFFSFLTLLVHGVVALRPPAEAQPLLLRLTSLSPLSLVVDGAGIDIFGIAPDAWWRPALGLLGLIVGLGGAAAVAYLRAQGPLGWESRGGRSAVAALVALALLVPVASAEVSFHEVEKTTSSAVMPGESTRVMFVPRGTPIKDAHFSIYAMYDAKPLVHGRENHLDALVMLLVPEGAAVRGVRIQVQGSSDLLVADGGTLVVLDGAPAGRAREGYGYGDDAASKGPLRPVYRVPVTVEPVRAQALLGSPAIVEVLTTFVADGRAHESHARMTLEADVPWAPPALLLSGAPLPLAALVALASRRILTR